MIMNTPTQKATVLNQDTIAQSTQPSTQVVRDQPTVEDFQKLIDKIHEDNLNSLLESTLQTIYEYGVVISKEQSTYKHDLFLNCKRYDNATTLNQKSQLAIMMLLDLLDYQKEKLSKSKKQRSA
jgi:hypothetical protein